MVAHAGGEAADQSTIAGVAVFVVPLDFLGTMVFPAPYVAVLLGNLLLFLASTAHHLGQSAIG